MVRNCHVSETDSCRPCLSRLVLQRDFRQFVDACAFVDASAFVAGSGEAALVGHEGRLQCDQTIVCRMSPKTLDFAGSLVPFGWYDRTDVRVAGERDQGGCVG